MPLYLPGVTPGRRSIYNYKGQGFYARATINVRKSEAPDVIALFWKVKSQVNGDS